jgi:hypothetical protein
VCGQFSPTSETALFLFEGFQALPVFPSDKSIIKMKIKMEDP